MSNLYTYRHTHTHTYNKYGDKNRAGVTKCQMIRGGEGMGGKGKRGKKKENVKINK